MCGHAPNAVPAEGTPQEQVTVGAPKGKLGRPSRLRMDSLHSPSGSIVFALHTVALEIVGA
jgi:hypothetical protein